MTDVIARRLRDFCDSYGISRSQAYIEIGAGRLRAVKSGNRTLVPEVEAKKWLAARDSFRGVVEEQATELEKWEARLNEGTPGGPTQLYRHFAKDGKLLYVGISLSALVRLSDHKAADWFPQISRVEVEHFETRRAARIAERRAIETENPKFNTQFSNPLSHPRSMAG